MHMSVFHTLTEKFTANTEKILREDLVGLTIWSTNDINKTYLLVWTSPIYMEEVVYLKEKKEK